MSKEPMTPILAILLATLAVLALAFVLLLVEGTVEVRDENAPRPRRRWLVLDESDLVTGRRAHVRARRSPSARRLARGTAATWRLAPSDLREPAVRGAT
jgi:hypothetical protein